MNSMVIDNLINSLPPILRGTLQANASLADYTSWRTGGKADYLYLPADLDDLSQFLSALPLSYPLTWLGLGSNTLIRDKGVEGVVIITQGMLNGLIFEQDILRVEAGVAAAKLARFTARLGLSGLEFMAGIPGTVGGALAMNAGCFGSETWTHVVAVDMMDRQGMIKKRLKNEFVIAYREVSRPQQEWFVAAYFHLAQGIKDESLTQIKTLLERRNATQPTGIANCGSVFRNPKGGYAGKLIEACGLKGKRIGGAVVSEKHANFILNESGQASAADIEHLIAEIKQTIYAKTGIELITEVCIIGRA